MRANILWTGVEYNSLENCIVDSSSTGNEVHSSIVGKYGDTIYQVQYYIRTNANWEVIFFEVKSRHNDVFQHLEFQGNGAGKWQSNNQEAPEFSNCIDIDIPLTPFTNTLPINRLKLAPGQEQTIQVIYIDLLEEQVNPLRQKYIRLSDKEYKYENVPNDFEAVITIDELGLVTNYPSLFTRTAIKK
jgi:uncharacterized protein